LRPVTEYFKTGVYQAKKSVATLSNAMDVGDPSNFVRMLELFNADHHTLSYLITSYSISDDETRRMIKEVLSDHGYLLDPHGAVAYASLKKYGRPGIFLETAHPVKFHDVVEPVIERKITVPASLDELSYRKKEAVQMKAEYGSLKEFLWSRFNQ
jgi:threonine synthase